MPREKRNRQTPPPSSDESDDCANDSGILTQEQENAAKEIVKNLMKKNRSQNYTDRARRREQQEKLATKLGEGDDAVADEDLRNLHYVIQDSTDVFQKIENAADGKELARDARVIRSLSSALLRKTCVVQNGKLKKFSIRSFSRRLKIYATEELEKEKKEEEKYADEATPFFVLDERDELRESDSEDEDAKENRADRLNRPQWALIGRRMVGLLHKAPQITCMNPMFHAEQDNDADEKKIKKERIKRPKEEKAELLKLVHKKEDDHANDEMAVSRELDNVRKAMRRAFRRNAGVVEYYRFVIDPLDFGKSIENIFHTSFLIKDGMARLDLNADELPTLYELNNEQREQMQKAEAEGGGTYQAIMPFSMTVWKDVIAALELTEPMIPQSAE